MNRQKEIDETQAALELLLGRLERLRRESGQYDKDSDPRNIGLAHEDVLDVMRRLERCRDETAAALATANTGFAVSRAYLSIGQATTPPEHDSATVLTFDKDRKKSHVARRSRS